MYNELFLYKKILLNTTDIEIVQLLNDCLYMNYQKVIT